MARYVSIYGNLYGRLTESMDAEAQKELMDKFLSEVLADAYGSIVRQRTSGRGAAKYTDIVRGVVGQRRGGCYNRSAV